MKRSFISTLIVCLVLQITLFSGCNPNEPGVGNADIGYEGFKVMRNYSTSSPTARSR